MPLSRDGGRPDLLERTSCGVRLRLMHVRLTSTGWSLIKAWLADIQAFVYSCVFRCVLEEPGRCFRTRTTRLTVPGFGLTVYGVPTHPPLLR